MAVGLEYSKSMILDEHHPAATANQDSYSFWNEQLINSRILLDKIDQAIYNFTSYEITEYTLDTGQDRQTVKRSDIGMLFQKRQELLAQIALLESRLGIGGSRGPQIIPGF